MATFSLACSTCGIEYVGDRSNGKFCGAKCRTADFYKNHPGYAKEKNRESRRKKRNPCLLCGRAIEFGSMGRRYHPECQASLIRAIDKAKRMALRSRVYAHKESIGCSECGYNKCGAALDWHHTDDNKERRITVRSYFTSLGEAERAKCVLLCANCHREHHWSDEDVQAALPASRDPYANE